MADNIAARNARQKQIDLLDNKKRLEDDKILSARIFNAANDLGITKEGGGAIDEEKLAAKLELGRQNNQLDPQLASLLVLMGNEDLAVKSNEGFKFERLALGPQGTFTLQGSYEGQDGNRYLTKGGEKGDAAPVAFMSVNDVAGHAATQYNQIQNRPGAAYETRELDLKRDLITVDSSVKEKQQAIESTVGTLTNDLEAAIFRIYPKEYASKMSRGMKEDLKNKSYSERLAILQEIGAKLEISEEDLSVSPDQIKAVSEITTQDSTGEQDAGQLKYVGKEREQLEEKLAAAKETLAKQEAVGPRSKLGGGRAYIRAAKKRVEKLEAQLNETVTEKKPTETKGLTKSQKKAAERQLVTAEKNLATAKKSGDQSYIERAQARVDKLNEKLGNADIEIEVKTPSIEAIDSKLENATEQDFVEGRVKYSEEELKALRERLDGKGIKKLEDAIGKDKKEILYIKGALSSVIQDQQQRKAMLDRLNNMLDTGMPGMSAKDLDASKQNWYTSATARMNSERQQTQLQNEIAKALDSDIQDSLKGLEKMMFNDDGSLKDYDMDDVDAAFFGPGRGFSVTWQKFDRQNRLAKRNGKQQFVDNANQLRQGLLAQLSLYVQLYNKSDDPEVSILATESGAPVNFSDTTMSRLAIAERDQKTGDPTVFHVIKPDSGTQDGDAITASQLKTKFGNDELYDFFVTELETFQANRPKK